MAHRQCRAALDAGRTVADDPVEFGFQLFDDLGDAFLGQRVLVASLRCRQQKQIFQPLIADQSLRQLGDSVDHIDQVEDHPPLGAEHEVEIAQADVEVDHDDLFAVMRERGAQ